ncbi:glycoside hydrolase family protein [Pelosinus propionicus]|uniref:Glycosyl hydrolases family 32 N-terminal domain-containing protein n=1 Tax=Pelosinus propionicus DSM 13327 TaxID=1123291 RepID=A0A1I4HT32_9FIRM|nr:hypothetical protein [Pelosinus propionicus]SFL45325.1 protein of unknown function [Pelosinus propionicus DSM 13327]
MKWRKMGQIFSFEDFNFRKEFVSHSQSPQAVVFDDYVRIYFSTRQKSENGKFLSKVQFIDFDKSFTKIINQSTKEVIKLGELGTFNEHGIFPFNPVKYKNKICAYTTGWTRRSSVDVDSGIGLAISHDGGESFEKMGDGPVLSTSLNEPFLVCDGFVRVFNDMFHMWYIYGTEWKVFEQNQEPERTYVIGHATSVDGINWVKEGRQIIESKYDGECQALPSIIQIGSRYHMYFCCRNSYDFRKNPQNSYRLGYAYSDDLINWIRDDENVGIEVSKTGWDSEMMCYPHIFEMDNEIYMLYNGNEFGRYGFGLAKLEEI